MQRSGNQENQTLDSAGAPSRLQAAFMFSEFRKHENALRCRRSAEFLPCSFSASRARLWLNIETSTCHVERRTCRNCHFDATRKNLAFYVAENASSLTPVRDDKSEPKCFFTECGVLPNYLLSAYSVRRSWAEKNRPQVVRFLKAVLRAKRWLEEDRNAATQFWRRNSS